MRYFQMHWFIFLGTIAHFLRLLIRDALPQELSRHCSDNYARASCTINLAATNRNKFIEYLL